MLWCKKLFEAKFEITAKILGPEQGQESEIRVLNRIIRWEAAGVVYEPDQRHVEMIIRELGLESAGSVLTLRNSRNRAGRRLRTDAIRAGDEIQRPRGKM